MLRVFRCWGSRSFSFPSNVLSYVGVPREKNNQISSMINFVRNIGGSIGIALIGTFVTRATQRGRAICRRTCNTGNPKFRQMVDGLAGTLAEPGMSPADAMHQPTRGWLRLMQQAGRHACLHGRVSGLADRGVSGAAGLHYEEAS